MPPNCSLLERARHDGEFGSYLEFFQNYATAPQSRLPLYANDKVLLDFIAEAKLLIKNHPGLETRNYYGGRNWDKLHYLLSEKRRKGDSQNESDWVKRAILGGNIIHPKTQTTIGSPIRYLAPAETHEIADRLSAISPDELRSNWSVEAMIEASVYKIHPEDNEQSFEWVETYYHQLTDFYSLATQYAEEVLTSLG